MVTLKERWAMRAREAASRLGVRIFAVDGIVVFNDPLHDAICVYVESADRPCTVVVEVDWTELNDAPHDDALVDLFKRKMREAMDAATRLVKPPRSPCLICGATDHERVQTVLGEVAACPQVPANQPLMMIPYRGQPPTTPATDEIRREFEAAEADMRAKWTFTFTPIEESAPATYDAIDRAYRRLVDWQRNERPGPLAAELDEAAEANARMVWSDKLQALQRDARERERHQVVLDMEWD